MRHRQRGMFKRAPHVTGVMENTPGVHDVVLAESFHIVTIEYVTSSTIHSPASCGQYRERKVRAHSTDCGS